MGGKGLGVTGTDGVGVGGSTLTLTGSETSPCGLDTTTSALYCAPTCNTQVMSVLVLSKSKSISVGTLLSLSPHYMQKYN